MLSISELLESITFPKESIDKDVSVGELTTDGSKESTWIDVESITKLESITFPKESKDKDVSEGELMTDGSKESTWIDVESENMLVSITFPRESIGMVSIT
jgi:hypothetical protein